MRKRLTALGLVMAAAIVFYVYSQSMTHSKKGVPVGQMSSDLAKVDSLRENRLSDLAEVEDKKRPPEKAWGRDPFSFPPGVRLRVAQAGKSSNAAEPPTKTKAIEPPVKKVTAILITDSRKVASINHKVVAVGDLIDGERVLEIKPDRVILEKDGCKQVITLDESTIQWTRNEGAENEK
jgi:type II secretory pathway component PulC